MITTFVDASEEVSALIATLHKTGQRLEELTAGEVDAVADGEGRTFLLRHAQEQLRQRDAGRQVAILNALPAHIALLDTQGIILSVNQAWCHFADVNAIYGAGHGIGLNYLDICDRAQGDGAAEAHRVAAGIRAVLAGSAKSFSIEYSCHSPTQQRWFLLIVTPLADDRPNGAVVMHLDVTAERQTQESLRASELRFRVLIENVSDVIILARPDGVLKYISPSMREMGGYEPDEMIGHNLFEFMHPDDVKQGMKVMMEINRSPEVPVRADLRFRHKNGSWQALEAICRNMSHLPTIGGVVMTVRNVTERNRVTQELRESRQRLDGIVSSAMDAIVTVDEEEHIVLANAAAEMMFGYTSAELQGQALQLLMPERYRAGHPAHVAAFGKSSDTSRRVGSLRPIRGLRRNGEEFPIEASISKDESTGRWCFTAILRDITERTNSDERIRRLNRVHAVLSQINALIVRVRDRDELFREACRIAVDAGGFRMSMIGIVDRSSGAIVPVASAGVDEALLSAIKGLLSSSEGAPNTLVARALAEKKAVVSNDSQSDPGVLLGRQHAESGVRSIAVLPLIIADAAVGVLVLYAGEVEFFHEGELKLLKGLADDVAFAIDHIHKQERLDYLAYYDVLTGLANRSLFLERVAQYMRSAVSGGYKLALYLIDLEHFKNINDSFGQAAGDALLGQVAEWLTHNLGDANLLARVGADHFAIVLPEIRQEDGAMAQLLEKLTDAFREQPFRLNDAAFRIAAKIGVALFPDDGADADTLLKMAEAALKKAKASGERYLFYTQDMTATVAGRLSLENQLRQALDKGEFVLHYQPKVNLASGKLTSAEALIRWNDPRTGMVPPGRFIPILEETGLIHDVGRWALHKAIEDYLRWRSAGLAAVRIAVNVSPLQLRHRGFIAEIRQAIGIDTHAAAGLELELTESLIMEDIRHSIDSLRAIRAMGVSVAIDDFGTGFSSLSYLSKLPVDTLKIDRSFVLDMTVSSEGLALVSTIISLAHSLKLKVVAEGVETGEQSRLLRLLNCDEMQGNLFSAAVPVEIFETGFLGLSPVG